MPGAYALDFRAHPDAYRYQSGEQDAFKVPPYKDELLPLWRYKDEAAAQNSMEAIYEKYEAYKADGDFVGMDMARKYLQMGFTRAMRYAKYPGGRKYDADGNRNKQETWADPDKRAAAVVFRDRWQQVKDDADYQRLKERHIAEVYDAEASPM